MSYTCVATKRDFTSQDCLQWQFLYGLYTLSNWLFGLSLCYVRDMHSNKYSFTLNSTSLAKLRARFHYWYLTTIKPFCLLWIIISNVRLWSSAHPSNHTSMISQLQFVQCNCGEGKNRSHSNNISEQLHFKMNFVAEMNSHSGGRGHKIQNRGWGRQCHRPGIQLCPPPPCIYKWQSFL